MSTMPGDLPGGGFAEYYWESMTAPQRRSLMAGHLSGHLAGPRSGTLRVLRSNDFVTPPGDGAPRLTERGTALATWVVRTGHWS